MAKKVMEISCKASPLKAGDESAGVNIPLPPSKGESVLAKAVCLAIGENFNNDPTAGTPAMAADNFLETKKSKSV
ncbi:hypothetical protein EFA69_08205 [Rufibacter immobilis]|uniref:Uncharacterized protein n=1 Tax=Rufibacter immobilis TaxID=1348778 RepID=A0A3M9MVP0_9BACT|nr:hypothetical protein [Rufibacter immobilis]RNI29530.1 hypothetical protein EFA69_08205 [Rufibacter immobilis]